MIDLDNWRFNNVSFSSAEDFCQHISEYGRQYQGRLQKCVMANSTYQSWKKASPPIKDMPFYRRYRQSEESKKFHASANAAASGTATNKDRERLTGLTQEIIQSPVILNPGQKLFHGRHLDIGNIKFPSLYPIPSFLSCTLCPEAAAWHAISKAAQYSNASNAALFIIRLETSCPAIFGAKGHLLIEQELLLPPTQTLQLTSFKSIPNGEFNIIHATLNYSP